MSPPPAEPSGPIEWPYPIEYGRTEEVDTDVLVIGGGASGCFAAMGAASRGARVVMWEKAATLTRGAMGSGCDHIGRGASWSAVLQARSSCEL